MKPKSENLMKWRYFIQLPSKLSSGSRMELTEQLSTSMTYVNFGMKKIPNDKQPALSGLFLCPKNALMCNNISNDVIVNFGASSIGFYIHDGPSFAHLYTNASIFNNLASINVQLINLAVITPKARFGERIK